MKTTLLFSLLAILILTFCASPQSQPDIPENILKRFNALYSNTKNVSWEVEDGRYEVDFRQNKNEFTVVFSADGSVEQTEVKSDVASLPPAVHEYVNRSLGGKKIEEVSRIVDGFGTITWEAEVAEEDYFFTADGKIIGKKHKAADENEDQD